MATLYHPSPRPTEDASRQALPLRVRRWLRELVSEEPPEVRRRRLEAEAAAQIGLTDRARDQIH